MHHDHARYPGQGRQRVLRYQDGGLAAPQLLRKVPQETARAAPGDLTDPLRGHGQQVATPGSHRVVDLGSAVSLESPDDVACPSLVARFPHTNLVHVHERSTGHRGNAATLSG